MSEKDDQTGFFYASVSDIDGGSRTSDSEPGCDAYQGPDRNDMTGDRGTEGEGYSGGVNCATTWVPAVRMATSGLG